MYRLLFSCLLASIVYQTSSAVVTTTTTNVPIHETIRSEYKQRNEKFGGKENTFLLCSTFGFDVSPKSKSIYQQILGEHCDKVTTQGNVVIIMITIIDDCRHH